MLSSVQYIKLKKENGRRVWIIKHVLEFKRKRLIMKL